MLGIDDKTKIDEYAKEVDNNLVKESVLKLKRLNQDVDFVYGISPEEEDVYIRNTEIYLAEKEAEERGEKRGKVTAYHELGLSIEEIIDKTGLTEQEINDILNS